MRGEFVIVRAHGNRPLVRRAWAVTQTTVLISDEAQFERLVEGREALQPVPFLREDVYQYDPVALAQLEQDGDWSRLILFTCLDLPVGQLA
jgi:hypothetical protein